MRGEMVAVLDFEDTGSGDEAVDLARRHLIQPWPTAGAIGAEARGLIGEGDGIYMMS